MAQQGNIQGVTQVSLLGQLSTALLDQVLRRLRAQAEHVCEFKMHEDVLTRGMSVEQASESEFKYRIVASLSQSCGAPQGGRCASNPRI